MALTIKKCFSFLALDSNAIRTHTHCYELLDKKSVPMIFYFNKEDAIQEAQAYASSHPKVPVLVMQSIAVIEAKRPETQQKEFKDNGELVPSKQAE